jgi:hypothetical protein
MPSVSFQQWSTLRSARLDEIEAAHRSIGGTGPGRRYATEQIDHAYAVLLASQFQGFCRDLHSECVDYLVRSMTPSVLRVAFRAEFLFSRSLDRGNATPATIGADFNRLGLAFWTLVYANYVGNNRRRELLDDLNRWRNAIAHQDFDPAVLGGTTTLHLPRVRAWRRACNRLARSFDSVLQNYLHAVTGNAPW